MLLSTAYFPPIEYFALLVGYSVPFYLEAHENYVKQTYRNRCRILTASGVEDLRVPVVHGESKLITDIKVDYSTPWLRRTEYAIDSAYYSSPFFEYYRDSLFAVLDSHPETLWELNRRITDYFCAKIGLAPDFRLTEDFAPLGGEDDYRFSIAPKIQSAYTGKEYWQVFKDKFGFIPNLSIMDLLFNEGPEAICYLKLNIFR